MLTAFPRRGNRGSDEKEIEDHHLAVGRINLRDPSNFYRPSREGHWLCLDLVSERDGGSFGKKLILRLDQQVDINRRSRSAVDCHCEAAAQRVFNPLRIESIADKIELGLEIEHRYTLTPNNSRNASGALAIASSSLSGSFPPACARSGLPPPLPPTIGASLLISVLA
ncbi:MAG: hypothetical protein QOK37_3925 [Thermoanaerobaculia bacterium]|nr:hypothetical protein [Thermoanaerobaculia bacterium]